MHQDNYSGEFQGEGAPDWATQDGGLANPSDGFPGNYFSNPAEGHAWDAFWGNASAPNGIGLEDNYAQAWETVASSLSGNSNVIGYDIMNEPFPGSSFLPTLLGIPFFGTQQLAPMYNQVDSAIRAVDPTTPIYIEPPNPAASEIPTVLGLPLGLGTVNDSNAVLAYHGYSAGIPFIGGFIVGQLANAAKQYGMQHDIPVVLDEFGATNDTSTLTTEMQPADMNQWSWTEWTYSGAGDITTSGNTDAESLVYNPLLPPTGDNVNTGNLTTLAEPYPQLISGTPTSYSFANGTFEFSYSTARADETGNFAAGSQTVISTPVVEFPSGYHVSVTGGHVVSATATQLVIASDPGATTVSVVVSPASSS